MFDVKLEAILGELNLTNFGKVFRDVMQRQMRNAARAFVRAAILRVPTDTGMARGTYLTIKKLLRISIPINPKSFGKFYYGDSEGVGHFGQKKGVIRGGVPKTPEAGAARSIPVNEIFDQKGDVYSFNYGNNVIHYNIEEFLRNRSPTSPWESFEIGRAAFLEYMDKNLLKKLPNIPAYLTYQTIIGSRFGISITSGRVNTTPSDGGIEV